MPNTPEEIKEMALAEQQRIDDFAKAMAGKTHDQLNVELASLIESHRPLQEKRVHLAMRMYILSQEIRLRMLKTAFPGIKIDEVTTLAELLPSDHVVGDTEKLIQQCKAQNVKPRLLQIDRIRKTIRLLE